jgi:PKD repeat protein
MYLCLIVGVMLTAGNGQAGAATVDYNLKTGWNGVALAIGDSGFTTAEQLGQAIPNCTAVSRWDAQLQGFIDHPVGTAQEDFALLPGQAYFVFVTADTVWTLNGNPPVYVNFHFVTTPTTNVSAFSIPLDRADLNTAEKVAQEVPNCDTIWKWDGPGQGWVGHPIGVGFNNFAVKPGDVLMARVTAEGYWPDPDENELPVIVVSNPANGSTSAELRPQIVVDYNDAKSGIDKATFYAELDGTDVTNQFVVGDNQATFTPAQDLVGGAHSVMARIADRKGNIGTDTSNFQIGQGLQALPGATPTAGFPPLTVRFTTAGFDPNGTITRYFWDYNGDGVWDNSEWGVIGETVPMDRDWVFNLAGVYNAKLMVRSNTGAEASTIITITVGNRPPTATAWANPSNGPIPLVVNFWGQGQDTDGQIVKYEWDFDGDGVWDYESATTGNTQHTYTTTGTKNAVFRVTDNEGATATALATTTTIRPGPVGSPTAVIQANPVTANAPLNVNFDAGLSLDGAGVQGGAITYNWDFTSDGTFDSQVVAPANNYPNAGTHIATLQVTDTNTNLSSIAQQVISIGINVTLTIPTNTAGFLNGQAQPIVGTNVRTTLSSGTEVSIYIKNSQGATVRNLVTNAPRAAGTYDDLWDCLDNAGNPVNDGIYYAVLQYKVDNEVRTLDQTLTTGGVRNTLPSGGGNNTRDIVTGTFNPYNDQLLPVNFRLNPAQEVTLFIGPLWTGEYEERTRTILNRVPMPTGAHTAYWDGFDDDGNVAQRPPGDELILGMWRYTLPTNAIYMTGGRPTITNMTSHPNYFSPVNKTCAGAGEALDVTYTVSEDVAFVELQVFETKSRKRVRTVRVNNVNAGVNHIYWDGKNDQGNFVQEGDYQLVLSATDAQGNSSLLAAVNVARVYY